MEVTQARQCDGVDHVAVDMEIVHSQCRRLAHRAESASEERQRDHCCSRGSVPSTDCHAESDRDRQQLSRVARALT